MRMKLALTLATAFVAAAVASCSGTPTQTDSDTSSSASYLAMSGEAPFTKNYNPFSESNLGGTAAIYETLFFANNQREANPEMQPVLGTEYAFSDDNRTLTITTRSGVTWNDGTPFGPTDVAFTFNYVQEHPEINSQGISGKAEVTGENEVTVTYPEPGVVRAITALTKQWILPEHVWKSVEEPATITNENPVGTGPFKPDTFSAQTYTLVKNPDYWDQGTPHIPGIRVINAADNDATSDLLSQGKLSWGGVTPPTKNYFEGSPNVQSVPMITGQLSFAACSNASMGCKGPQTDPAVRKALYYALDRSQLNKLAFAETAGDISPTYAILPRDKRWISPSIEDPIAAVSSGAQVQKAEQTLQAAGYTKGRDGIYQKDGERVSLTVVSVNGWTDWQNAANTAVQQVKAAGIELKTQYVSASAWSTDSSQGNFQLLVWNVTPGSVVEPFGTYQSYFGSESTAKVGESTPGLNYARYENTEVDAALKVLENTQDEATQAEQYAKIQQRIVEDMPYIPMIGYSNWVQFDVERFENWPTEDNAYAGAFSWMTPDFGIVLKNVKPKTQ